MTGFGVAGSPGSRQGIACRDNVVRMTVTRHAATGAWHSRHDVVRAARRP